MRKKQADKFHQIFTILLLESKVQKMDKFRIDMKYNSRLDSDNTIPMIKFLVDSMKGKYIVDDTKKYFRGFSITPEESLDKKTYVFTISEVI